MQHPEHVDPLSLLPVEDDGVEPAHDRAPDIFVASDERRTAGKRLLSATVER